MKKKKNIKSKKTVKKKTIKKLVKSKKIIKTKVKKNILNKKKKLINIDHKDILQINQKSRIIGEINHPTTVIINGEFHGEIKSHKTILSITSKVSGTIKSNFVVIEGKCNAEIFSNKLCEIKKSAEIRGDINYNDNIIVESGAKILGNLIPKIMPLALPDYTKKNNTNFSDSTNQNKNFQNITTIDNNTNFKGPSLDKIINKIFK